MNTKRSVKEIGDSRSRSSMVIAAPKGGCAAICDGESERVSPLGETTRAPIFFTDCVLV